MRMHLSILEILRKRQEVKTRKAWDLVQHQAQINLMKKYDSTVLIKLRRTYSENESVMWALNKLKDMLVERGQNNAYIHELEDKVDKLGKELLKKEKQIPLTEDQRREYDQYMSMKVDVIDSKNKMKKEIERLTKDNKELVGRIVRMQQQ